MENNGWISVKGDLPKFNESVLAFATGLIYIGYIVEFGEDDNPKWSLDGEDDIFDHVSFWQPLPSPPVK